MASSAPATDARRPRILTPALVVFLAAVVTIDLVALVVRWIPPSPAEAVRLLADGDLDGDERRQALQVLVRTPPDSADVERRWGALLAAVALEDRAVFAAQVAALGGIGATMKTPSADMRAFLDLGDPLIGNVAQALLAEASGDRTAAHRRWQQVATQCQLMVRPFAAELAADGVRRTT
ncbi:MAG: hypothetical protein JNK78_16660 [Planctomycetes bacterium]|nr:hypothetical protein [Planctomycetota bacterium]